MTLPLPLALPAAVHQHLAADGAELARQLAAAVATGLAAAIAARGRATLLLSGGRSPVPFFEALAREPLDWAQVTLSLVDERWVPATHADSNEGLIRHHLLQGPAAAARFVGLSQAPRAAGDALADVESALAALAPFDLVVLGMGDDAHTASLFPNLPETAAALRPDARLATILHPQTAAHARASLTLHGLRQARAWHLQIQGLRKRAVLEQSVGRDPLQCPIASVLDGAVPLHVWYAD